MNLIALRWLMWCAALALGLGVWTAVGAEEGDARDAEQLPSPPSGLSLMAYHDRMILSWDDPGDASVTHYKVWRLQANSHPWPDFEPLTLELTSSRQLCTANTLTELSWVIAGGKPPYTLTIEGETVDAEAESHRVNCGALMIDPETEAPLPNQTKSFSASVSDALISTDSAVGHIDVALADALPPPARIRVVPTQESLSFGWWERPDAPKVNGQAHYLARWRESRSSAWTYVTIAHAQANVVPTGLHLPGLAEAASYEAAFASLRHPIESETVGALAWSPIILATTSTVPTGVLVTATHDSLTVSWDRQPTSDFYSVQVHGPSGSMTKKVRRDFDVNWSDSGRHQLVFEHLPADTQYEVEVENLDSSSRPGAGRLITSVTSRTERPPTGWRPLPRGAKNTRTSSTSDTITVSWDQPFADASPAYLLRLYHPERARPRFERVWQSPHTFTFKWLESGLTYRVEIVHLDIIEATRSLSVTTELSSSSRAKATSEQARIPGEIPFPFWPRPRPQFAWPMAFNNYLRMTTDA